MKKQGHRQIFYIGSRTCIEGPRYTFGGHTHETVQSAIEHAKERFTDEDENDVLYIVKVVRRVRRIKPIVEVKVDVLG